jgi:hypothetical protein
MYFETNEWKIVVQIAGSIRSTMTINIFTYFNSLLQNLSRKIWRAQTTWKILNRSWTDIKIEFKVWLRDYGLDSYSSRNVLAAIYCQHLLFPQKWINSCLNEELFDTQEGHYFKEMLSSLLVKRRFKSFLEVQERFRTYLRLHVKFYVKEQTFMRVY